MGKVFREWRVDQPWLLPPSIDELLPPGHLARFVLATVREDLDLSEVLSAYDEERGFPPYHPAMMTALLLYSYCRGVYSSRRMARACQERLDFMVITAQQQPDFRTVSDFRKRHLPTLARLFGQVLRLCDTAGMVKLGHVALDGTKVLANASKRKAMSYERMKNREREITEEIASWFAKAEAADEAEDREFGAERRGDELPDWVANKQLRREKIREAMAQLEKAAKAVDDNEQPKPPSGGGGKRRKGRRHEPKDGEPHPKAQLNFTDPDSKILKTSNGFVQGYNCQAAVDGAHQVIVAHDLVNDQNDAPLMPGLVRQIKRNVGRQAKEISADYGYCSEENLKVLARHHVSGYIATGRQKHSRPDQAPLRTPRGRRVIAMQTKIARAGHRSRYRLRKQIVEPAFGQIKEAGGFRRFLLRGMKNVPHEWALVCTAHNLRKLARKAG